MNKTVAEVLANAAVTLAELRLLQKDYRELTAEKAWLRKRRIAQRHSGVD